MLSAPERAERLLALTGLTPEALRAGLGQRPILAAVLEFLCGHEPDLLAAARALEIEPPELVAAKENLLS